MGIEHSIKDVKAEISRGRLTLLLGAKKKPITFDAKDIDPAAARAFVERLQKMQASPLAPPRPEAPHQPKP